MTETAHDGPPGASQSPATAEEGSGVTEAVEGRPAVLAERLAERYAPGLGGQDAKFLGDLLRLVADDVHGGGICPREVALAVDFRAAAAVLHQRFLDSRPRRQ